MFCTSSKKGLENWSSRFEPPNPINHLCSLTGVCVFHKSILLIVQYKILKSKLQNLILRTILCGTGFISQHGWVVDFHVTKMVKWKCFAPGLYQLRKGKSTGWPFNILTWFTVIGWISFSRGSGPLLLNIAYPHKKNVSEIRVQHIYMYMHIYTHTQIYIYICIYIHTRTYICGSNYRTHRKQRAHHIHMYTHTHSCY